MPSESPSRRWSRSRRPSNKRAGCGSLPRSCRCGISRHRRKSAGRSAVHRCCSSAARRGCRSPSRSRRRETRSPDQARSSSFPNRSCRCHCLPMCPGWRRPPASWLYLLPQTCRPCGRRRPRGGGAIRSEVDRQCCGRCRADRVERLRVWRPGRNVDRGLYDGKRHENGDRHRRAREQCSTESGAHDWQPQLGCDGRPEVMVANSASCNALPSTAST